MEFLIFVVVFFVGYSIGDFVSSVKTRMKEIEDVKDLKDKLLVCKVSIVDDHLYAYELYTSKFITQGSNYKEIETEVKRKFPNKTILFVK